MFQSDEDGARIFAPGYVLAAKTLQDFINKIGGSASYIEKENGDIVITGFLVETIFYMDIYYTFRKDADQDEIKKYCIFLQDIGVEMYDAFAASKSPGLERLQWYAYKWDINFKHEPPRFVTLTADFLMAEPWGIGPGNIISLLKGEHWRTGKPYSYSDIAVDFLLSITLNELVPDEMLSAFSSMFLTASKNEISEFYDRMKTETSISKNIRLLRELKDGFGNIFPESKFEIFSELGINPERCFVVINSEELYGGNNPIQKRNRILSFYNTISADIINFIDSETELDARMIMDFINERIDASNISGIRIFLLE